MRKNLVSVLKIRPLTGVSVVLVALLFAACSKSKSPINNPVNPTPPPTKDSTGGNNGNNESMVVSGTCGQNLTWSFDTTTDVLTISGNGAMDDYPSSADSTYIDGGLNIHIHSTAPWDSIASRIKQVQIGNNVTSIGNYAFAICTGLTSITIGNSVTSIGEYAFVGCTNLTSLTIPNSITSIGSYAFYGCSSLAFLTIGSGVTSIGEEAFNNCSNLSTINFNAVNCTIMGNGYGAYLNGNYLVSNNWGKLTTVNIGDSVTTIPDYAFDGCTSLTSVTIPNSVTNIGTYAFAVCGLTSITIPNSVTSIESYAFYNCSNLTSITCLNPVPPKIVPISGYAFIGVNTYTCELKVPSASVALYQQAAGWSDFTNIVGM